MYLLAISIKYICVRFVSHSRSWQKISAALAGTHKILIIIVFNFVLYVFRVVQNFLYSGVFCD